MLMRNRRRASVDHLCLAPQRLDRRLCGAAQRRLVRHDVAAGGLSASMYSALGTMTEEADRTGARIGAVFQMISESNS